MNKFFSVGKSALIVALLLSMYGCASIKEQERLPNEVRHDMKQAGAHIVSKKRHVSTAQGSARTKLVMPRITIGDDGESVLGRKFTLVVRRVPIRSILYSLAKDAGLQLDLHPIKNRRVTLMLKEVPLKVILDKLSQQAELVYHLKNNVLTISQDVPVWKTYRIDYVNIAKKTSGKISLNMSVGNGGVAGQGVAIPDSGDNSTQVSVESDQNFWKELEDGLSTLLGTGAGQKSQPLKKGASALVKSYIINREAGTVSVRAPERVHKIVRQYIDTLLARAKKQVLIEATVVEVELSDQFQSGIDWSALRVSNSPNGQLPVSYPIQIVSDPRLNNIARAFNFSLGIRFLQRFGKTKVLSTPKIMALNNQTAILKVVDNQVYFTTKVNTNTNQTTSITTYQTEVHTVPVGFMMTLTPFVGDNGDITLYVRPTLSRILGYVNDPNPALKQAGAVSQVPIIQEREISSTLRLKDGQVAIIGGLMQDARSRKRDQLPGFGDVPGAGELFAYNDKNNKKTELVIFIRPVIVKKPSINADLSMFKKQFGHIQ